MTCNIPKSIPYSKPQKKSLEGRVLTCYLTQNNNETLCFELDFFKIIPANRYGVSVNLFLAVASAAVLSGAGVLCVRKNQGWNGWFQMMFARMSRACLKLRCSFGEMEARMHEARSNTVLIWRKTTSKRAIAFEAMNMDAKRTILGIASCMAFFFCPIEKNPHLPQWYLAVCQDAHRHEHVSHVQQPRIRSHNLPGSPFGGSSKQGRFGARIFRHGNLKKLQLLEVPVFGGVDFRNIKHPDYISEYFIHK